MLKVFETHIYFYAWCDTSFGFQCTCATIIIYSKTPEIVDTIYVGVLWCNNKCTPQWTSPL